MDNLFERCGEINDLLINGRSIEARDQLIQLLDSVEQSRVEYTPLLNHLIRETGLYPYIRTDDAIWQDRFVYSAFRVRTGGKQMATLHREQAQLLSQLLDGKEIAVSAPTSFGKSFVIDAYIQLKEPDNVMIIVPTIALMDETRRRLYKKFATRYTIITTPEADLGKRNIFIFPAERAINYLKRIPHLDLFVVDEFYKASSDFDKDRAPELLRAILKLSEKTSQRYFLAPNISSLSENIFTKGMQFVNLLEARTVFLQRHDVYEELNSEEDKGAALLHILGKKDTKSLIYAGTFTEIKKVANLLIETEPFSKNRLVNSFAHWLSENYEANWRLTNLVRRGTGVHNSRLHRSLSQLQIRLFEEPDGFSNILSTSSIIEGVNTSAENVIVWRNKNGSSNLNDFTYKNIIGRGGRMFRHFVGQVYLLEKPPNDEPTALELPFPDEILGTVEDEGFRDALTDEQIKTVTEFKEHMYGLIGQDKFEHLLKENSLRLANAKYIKKIAGDMVFNPEEWHGLGYLNSDRPRDWDRSLYKMLEMRNVAGLPYKQFIAFIRILSQNWYKSISQLLFELDDFEIGIEDFFELERNVVFKLSSLVSDVNELQKVIAPEPVDLSPFIFKASHAFLPPVVHQLEEFGMPRMIAKKIQMAGLINFEDRELNVQTAIDKFHSIGQERVHRTPGLKNFDHYILEFFYDGITTEGSYSFSR